MDNDTVDANLAKVAEAVRKLPKEAIQKTDKKKTGKGYDTTGYGIDWMWELLIEEFGPSRIHIGFSDLHIEDAKTSTGKTKWIASVRSTIRIVDGGKTLAETSAFGGHDALLRGDALKGTECNSLKKALAKWGVGIDAYKGILDADNEPLPEASSASKPEAKAAKAKKPSPYADGMPMRKEHMETLELALAEKFEVNTQSLNMPRTLTVGMGAFLNAIQRRDVKDGIEYRYPGSEGWVDYTKAYGRVGQVFIKARKRAEAA